MEKFIPSVNVTPSCVQLYNLWQNQLIFSKNNKQYSFDLSNFNHESSINYVLSYTASDKTISFGLSIHDNFLSFIDNELADASFDQFNDEIKSILINTFAQCIADEFNSYKNCTILPCKIESDSKSIDYTFALHLQDSANNSICSLNFSDKDNSFEYIKSILNVAKSKNFLSNIGNVCLPFNIELGSSSLSRGELDSLLPGDVILLKDSESLKNKISRFSYDSLSFLAMQKDGSKYVLTTDVII